MMDDLFHTPGPAVMLDEAGSRPLADLLRPQCLADIVGQAQLVGPDGILTRFLEGNETGSLIFHGPPGCGKTTAARLLSKRSGISFKETSALHSGVAALKKIFDEARQLRALGRQLVLFVDEIHRFNRAQQDSFLPVIEDGTLILIGATTENPSFEINAALLSRCRVVRFNRLDDEALAILLERAGRELADFPPLTDDARQTLIRLADGDGRALLNMVAELTACQGRRPVETDDEQAALEPDVMLAWLERRAAIYDKTSDGHYSLISALHKSVRGSDPQAALYWLMRMLDAGEDPLYLARRLVRMAVEDIGLADPAALTQAMAAQQAFSLLGSPEGELALAQAAVYLATAPKSNAVYRAFKQARQSAADHGSLPPPPHIVNAPTALMRKQGYGRGYKYDHDEPDAFSGQNYFPDQMAAATYYTPEPRGFEREIAKRLAYWAKRRAQKSGETQ